MPCFFGVRLEYANHCVKLGSKDDKRPFAAIHHLHT